MTPDWKKNTMISHIVVVIYNRLLLKAIIFTAVAINPAGGHAGLPQAKGRRYQQFPV
jgi:hypothetical protein